MGPKGVQPSCGGVVARVSGAWGRQRSIAGLGVLRGRAAAGRMGCCVVQVEAPLQRSVGRLGRSMGCLGDFMGCFHDSMGCFQPTHGLFRAENADVCPTNCHLHRSKRHKTPRRRVPSAGVGGAKGGLSALFGPRGHVAIFWKIAPRAPSRGAAAGSPVPPRAPPVAVPRRGLPVACAVF